MMHTRLVFIVLSMIAALLIPGRQVGVHSAQPAVQITVTNASDRVDGDTSSMTALQASPGPDGGISLRESILATNHTSGPKAIAFASSVADIPIVIGQPLQCARPDIRCTKYDHQREHWTWNLGQPGRRCKGLLPPSR
jgi:hypothetical protein